MHWGHAVSTDLVHWQELTIALYPKKFGDWCFSGSVIYNVAKQELSCQGKTAPLKPTNGTIQLDILLDRTSIEIFANGGKVYMPLGVIPANNDRSLRLSTTAGAAKIQSLEIYQLRSAWE